MNTDGQNIANAFSVVRKTYESVNKLHNHILNNTNNDSKYILCVDHFMRWISSANYKGWLNNSFIFIFQKKTHIELENSWRNGPVFAFEINFLDDKEPKAIFSKHEYARIEEWLEGCSTGSHWAFWAPVHNDIGRKVDCENGITEVEIDNKAISNRYWGLSKVRFVEMPLVHITGDNFDSILEKKFDSLL